MILLTVHLDSWRTTRHLSVLAAAYSPADYYCSWCSSSQSSWGPKIAAMNNPRIPRKITMALQSHGSWTSIFHGFLDFWGTFMTFHDEPPWIFFLEQLEPPEKPGRQGSICLIFRAHLRSFWTFNLQVRSVWKVTLLLSSLAYSRISNSPPVMKATNDSFSLI